MMADGRIYHLTLWGFIMMHLIRPFFFAVLAMLVLVGTTHAQEEFDPRVSERMDTLLGESFDVAKGAIGFPDGQTKLGKNFIYTYTLGGGASGVCIIKLDVSPQFFGFFTRIVGYEIRGNDEACLWATRRLEAP